MAFFEDLGNNIKKEVQPIIDNINGAFAAIREKEETIARIEAEALAGKEKEAGRKQEAEARARSAYDEDARFLRCVRDKTAN